MGENLLRYLVIAFLITFGMNGCHHHAHAQGIPIAALPAATTVGSADLLIVSQNAVTKKATISLFGAAVQPIAANTLLGNNTAATALPSALTVTQTQTLLGLGTAAYANLGTSGNTVPVLSAANTWSALQTLTAGVAISGGITITGGLTTDTLHVTSTSLFDSTATFGGAVAMSPATGLVSIGPTTTGSIDNMTIGSTTRSSGKFTTLDANSTVTLSPTGSVTINPSTTVSIAPTGVLTINPTAASTINNASVGVTTPLAGNFTTIGATTRGTIAATTGNFNSTLTVSSGGAAITGNTSISSGSFTASGGAFAASPASANVVLSPTGTGVVTINPATAGTMDNVAVGATTPLAGTFTALKTTGTTLTFQSAGTTGTLTWAPSSSGKTITLPNGTTDFTATGATNAFLKQNSAGAAITVATIACADLSNGATGCSTATGTSGATIPLLNGTNTWSGVQTFSSGNLKIGGAGAGAQIHTYANSASNTTITWPAGTTDFSATGGTNQLVKQATSGGAFTVGTVACSGLSDGATGCSTATGTSGATIPLLNAANTWSAKQTFNGSTSVAAAALVNAVEPATISATAATGTINYDVSTQSVLYYTTSASANWTTNFRWSSGTSANTAMATGDIVTAVFMVTQGATAYYNNTIQVDGNAVTPKWQGGTAPSAGNVSGIDVYTYSIIKTGNAAFTILASQTQFK